MRFPKKAVLGLAVAAVAFGAVAALRGKAPSRRAAPERGGDFTLHGAGGPWTLSQDGHGFITLLYFGFTHCPGLCPTTMASVQKSLAQLEARDRARIKVVFVSVDYRADTPASVDAYARPFGSGFIGLTGSKAELDLVTERYGAAYEVKETAPGSGKFRVDHSSQVFVVDPQGRLADWVTVGYQDAKLGLTLPELVRRLPARFP